MGEFQEKLTEYDATVLVHLTCLFQLPTTTKNNLLLLLLLGYHLGCRANICKTPFGVWVDLYVRTS